MSFLACDLLLTFLLSNGITVFAVKVTFYLLKLVPVSKLGNCNYNTVAIFSCKMPMTATGHKYVEIFS